MVRGWEREREEDGAYEESPVESLAALALDGVVGRAALSGVGATTGFALGRRSRGRGRVRSGRFLFVPKKAIIQDQLKFSYEKIGAAGQGEGQNTHGIVLADGRQSGEGHVRRVVVARGERRRRRVVGRGG